MFGSNEDISVMKINTHAGQDAFVYIMQKNPSLFEFNKIIFPTGLPSISFFALASVLLTLEEHSLRLIQRVCGRPVSKHF